MRLIVCCEHVPDGRRPSACGNAHAALREAGHDPTVERAYGWRIAARRAQRHASGRREANRRTGKVDVPVLILDDDTTVAGAKADRRAGRG